MIKVGDEFIHHWKNGTDHRVKVIKKNNSVMDPGATYICDEFDENGVYNGDTLICGEDFFAQDCVEKEFRRVKKE